MRTTLLSAALLAAYLSATTTAQPTTITVGAYTDSKCTTLNPAQPALHPTANGACITNPLNAAQATQITCAADDTWTFNAYLNGQCTGPAVFNQKNLANNYCLNVIGNYIGVNCGSTASATSNTTASSAGGALSSLLTSNSSIAGGNQTTILVTIPVYNVTAFNYTLADSTLAGNKTGLVNQTLYTQLVVVNLTAAGSNMTNYTNITSSMAAALVPTNISTVVYTDMNVTNSTTFSPAELLINSLPGFKFNSSNTNLTSITSFGNSTNVTAFGIYNSSALTNTTSVITSLTKLFNISAHHNTSLTVVLAYLPVYNQSAPLVIDLISTIDVLQLLEAASAGANSTGADAVTGGILASLGSLIAP